MHGFPSSQLETPAQTPAVHLSPEVQLLPSSHGFPVRGVALHLSFVSSQAPVLHWSVSDVQSLGVPPPHVPVASHVSFTVQNDPSLHGDPAGSFALQVSVASLQLSLQFPSPSGPGQGGDPCRLQTPALHVSVPLQKSPSSHGVPVKFVQVPAVPWPLHVTQSVVAPPPQAEVQHTPSTHVVPG